MKTKQAKISPSNKQKNFRIIMIELPTGHGNFEACLIRIEKKIILIYVTEDKVEDGINLLSYCVILWE